MRWILSASTVLGLIGVAETFGILMLAKLHVYHHLELTAKRHRKFLDQIKKPLQNLGRQAWIC